MSCTKRMCAHAWSTSSAPEGEAWTGHSLRKGAASGANAIDVALFRVCYMGGWSVRGGAVHDYIDATSAPTRRLPAASSGGSCASDLLWMAVFTLLFTPQMWLCYVTQSI